MSIQVYGYDSEEGGSFTARLRDRFSEADHASRATVATMLAKVRQEGDAAVLAYTRQYDGPALDPGSLRVSEEEFATALAAVDAPFYESLRLAASRIQAFHEREMADSWLLTGSDGTITGRLVRPVDSAGLYVPGGQGGKTPLVSSVLMNGIPARIAGVGRRVMVTPPNEEGRVSPHLLAAAREVGIDEVYKAGSAWAIAALAYGTETIPRVDVIVGPGNQYVTEAKRQVMGRVRIDMIAGPSEVLIIADSSSEPAYIAADLLAQAEHDSEALAVVITTSGQVAKLVAQELERQLPLLPRQEIAAKALAARGGILVVKDLASAMELANEIAIEHLELQIEDPWSWLPMVRHAGAVFLGRYSPEAAGDYVAGPNHVLPTMGTAKISSALGVETFLKMSSIISCSRQALLADAAHIQRLANLEGLTAHARSVAIRVQREEP